MISFASSASTWKGGVMFAVDELDETLERLHTPAPAS